MSRFRGFQSIKVLTGKYEGLVGSVVECRDDTEMVKVEIQGMQNDLLINKTGWFKFVQVEEL